MSPPSLVSTMSMSFTPQSPTESFVSAGPLPKAEAEHQRKPLSAAAWDVSAGKAALPGPQSHGQKRKMPGLVEGATEGDIVGKKSFSKEEILQHRTEDDALIVVDGKVYDVTPFLETHPGGREVILDHLHAGGWRDAGPSMRGELDDDGHSHSKVAFHILEQFLVGFVEASPGSHSTEGSHGKQYKYHVDLSKPLVPQVGYLGEDYDEWVHDPVVCKESPRFFENDIFEGAVFSTFPKIARAIALAASKAVEKT